MGIGGSNLGQSTEVERQRRDLERLWVDCQESGGDNGCSHRESHNCRGKNL